MALPKWATQVTPFSKALALVIFISFPVIGFFLGRWYEVSKVKQLAQFSTPISWDTCLKKETVVPTSVVASPVQSPTSFQEFLLRECAADDTIAVDKLSFILTDEIMNKFNLVGKAKCIFFDGRGGNIGYVSAIPAPGGRELPVSLYLGDFQSSYHGMESFYLDYDKDLAANPSTVVYDETDIKVTARGRQGIVSTTDLGYHLLIRAYKNLGDYRAVIESSYRIGKSPEFAAIVRQYGQPISDSHIHKKDGATYEVKIGQEKAFESAVIAAYLTNKSPVSSEVTTVIQSMITDLGSISLK